MHQLVRGVGILDFADADVAGADAGSQGGNRFDEPITNVSNVYFGFRFAGRSARRRMYHGNQLLP